jgi:FkbM family methyltransferase
MNYEPPIFRVLDQLMSHADTFVNVGANHGVYCLKFVNKAQVVFAVEALANNLRFLYKNVRENGLQDKIFVLPVAAGSKPSLATFYGADTGGSLLKGWNQQVDTGVDVPIFPLDMLLQVPLQGKRLLFLIDVEVLNWRW